MISRIRRAYSEVCKKKKEKYREKNAHYTIFLLFEFEIISNLQKNLEDYYKELFLLNCLGINCQHDDPPSSNTWVHITCKKGNFLYKYNPQLGFFWCFLIITFSLCIFGSDITEMMLCYAHSILSGGTWFWFATLLMLIILVIWLKWWFSSFSTVKLLFSPLYLISILWGGSLKVYKYSISPPNFTY